MNTTDGIRIDLQNVDDIFIKNIGPLNCNRLLNHATEEFIIEEAGKLPRRIPICLTIQIPPHEMNRTDEIITAVHSHFARCRKKSKEKVKTTLQAGRRSLLIGFAFLILIYSLVQLLGFYFSGSAFFSTIRESLTIIAWVALWRPAELLLYEWYPFLHEAKLFHRLEQSNVRTLETPTRSNT